MGSISKKDVLILISYSEPLELKNIINYVTGNKILLIGITSQKNLIYIKIVIFV